MKTLVWMQLRFNMPLLSRMLSIWSWPLWRYVSHWIIHSAAYQNWD